MSQQRSTAISQHWLLGVGFAPDSAPGAEYDIPDSSALTVVVRFGVVGVVLILSLIGQVVRNASRMRRRDDPQSRAVAALAVGFIAFLVLPQ